MDKTRNKIFVGCLALLLVMVAGYALFSQNLNITGTAKAQGDFSVTATCQPGIPENLLDAAKYSIVEYYSKTWVDENGYYDDSCTVKGDTVSDFDTMTEEEINNLLPDGEYLKPGFSYYFLGVTGWVNIDSPENYKMLAKTTFSTKLTYKQPAVK